MIATGQSYLNNVTKETRLQQISYLTNSIDDGNGDAGYQEHWGAVGDDKHGSNHWAEGKEQATEINWHVGVNNVHVLKGPAEHAQMNTRLVYIVIYNENVIHISPSMIPMLIRPLAKQHGQGIYNKECINDPACSM